MVVVVDVVVVVVIAVVAVVAVAVAIERSRPARAELDREGERRRRCIHDVGLMAAAARTRGDNSSSGMSSLQPLCARASCTRVRALIGAQVSKVRRQEKRGSGDRERKRERSPS